LLLFVTLGGCADRDIHRAQEAVPHQRGENSAATPTPAQPPTPTAPPLTPSTPTPATKAQALQTSGTREVFPHIRVDASKKLVEFDASIPLNARDPQKPRQYLEVMACIPDSKEHEAVLLTKAKPSQVHAALLLIGLEPGSPGVWNWEGEKLEAVTPKGARVKVTAVYTLDGKVHEVNPADWVLNVQTQKTLAQSEPDGRWVFAGSQMIRIQSQEIYRADGPDGTLIGLHTFGGETLAWSRMYNPDAGVEEPRWIVNPATLPPYDTPVVVRITKAE
jgi:hypothetical protein